jgi:hypothetical protein
MQITPGKATWIDWKSQPRIDAFDCIVRFNRAPTIGYEQDVGSQTDLYVVNSHVFTNQRISDSGWTEEHYATQPQFFVRDLRNAAIYGFGPNFPPTADAGQYTHSSNAVFYFEEEQMEALRKTCGFKIDPGVGTGFIGLCVIGGFDVHLFGIDVTERDRDHYWETRPPAGPCHDINNEQKILRRWIANGSLIHHEGVV